MTTHDTPTAASAASLPEGAPVCTAGSPFEAAVEQCRTVAPSSATVLLMGETGTGKEVLARCIHGWSKRANAPFVAVNIAAIPDALLESELFGHKKGAFTGADRDRRGRVAAAEGGTLFLDEIGDLPLALQVKLLRLLQERTYEVVGDNTAVSADFRLIVATHKNLAEEVEAGRFRRDLYYRLFVCPVELPPLRQRPDDIEELFFHFWKRRGETRAVSEGVIAHLRACLWPGNVRELENVVERLSVCSTGTVITEASLPPLYRMRRRAETPSTSMKIDAATSQPAVLSLPALPAPVPGKLPHMNLIELLREIEATYVDAALLQTGGNRQAAATLLGLQRTTLVEKLRRRQAKSTRARSTDGGGRSDADDANDAAATRTAGDDDNNSANNNSANNNSNSNDSTGSGNADGSSARGDDGNLIRLRSDERLSA